MASGAEEANHCFDTYMQWSTDALKDHLNKYGLKVTGKKEHLAARALFAHEMNLQPTDKEFQLTDKEVSHQGITEDKMCDTKIVDPFGLEEESWISEAEGMQHWPPVIVLDIMEYFGVQKIDPKLLQEYKQGKAYRYFQKGIYYYN